MHTLLVQLPKPGGSGYRVIGLLPTLFRIWGRLRQPLLREWEASIDSPVDFAARAGSGSIDACWDIAYGDELCQAQGRHVAASISDLSKFYEMIVLSQLLHGCRNLTKDSPCCGAFLVSVAALCVVMYTGRRRVVVSGSVSSGVRVWQGVIAGCTAATYLAKAH